MQLLHHLVLLATTAVLAVSAADSDVRSAAQQQTEPRTHLRGLLDKIVASPQDDVTPVRRLVADWEDGKVGEARQLRPITEKIVGGETILVFNDRRLSPEDKMESAVVNFDVRSSSNCVVSVCGELTNWYLGSKEKCFDLRIAQKSADQLENGLIRGVSAAYWGDRPVAQSLYLKFDETNFIDGSTCKYEILNGSKTVRERDVVSGSQAASLA